MPANKKPRKPHKRIEPKNHVEFLLDADAPMKGEERLEVLTSVHIAAIDLCSGTATKDRWDEIVVAMNIAAMLCETAGNKERALQAVYDTLNTMIDVAERYQASQAYTLTPGDLSAINGGIHVFEQLVDTVSRRQYTRACAEYTKRLAAGKAVQIRAGLPTRRFALTSETT
jgi:hypothetical protein